LWIPILIFYQLLLEEPAVLPNTLFILYIMTSSRRHFTVIVDSKEHGLYVSSTPSSAARKAVSKLCANNKNKKVEFYMRETTQVSNKKVYGPYLGEMKKLEGRIIRYKPIVKLLKKINKMKGGNIIAKGSEGIIYHPTTQI
jgi:hypothetical protein